MRCTTTRALYFLRPLYSTVYVTVPVSGSILLERQASGARRLGRASCPPACSAAAASFLPMWPLPAADIFEPRAFSLGNFWLRVVVVEAVGNLRAMLLSGRQCDGDAI